MNVGSLITKKTKKQVKNFIWTGIISSSVDLVTVFILVDVFQVKVLIATGISIIAATITNYFLNIKYVFVSGKHHKSIEVIMFFSLAGFGLLFNVFMMWFLYSLLQIWYIAARIVAIFLNVIINFFVKKQIIFSE